MATVMDILRDTARGSAAVLNDPEGNPAGVLMHYADYQSPIPTRPETRRVLAMDATHTRAARKQRAKQRELQAKHQERMRKQIRRDQHERNRAAKLARKNVRGRPMLRPPSLFYTQNLTTR